MRAWPRRSRYGRGVQYAQLGPLRVSRVGLGCNNFGGRLSLARTRLVVDAAIDAGVTFLDTADIYGGRSGPSRYGNTGGSDLKLGDSHAISVAALRKAHESWFPDFMAGNPA